VTTNHDFKTDMDEDAQISELTRIIAAVGDHHHRNIEEENKEEQKKESKVASINKGFFNKSSPSKNSN